MAQEHWFDVLHQKCREHYDEEINQLIFSYHSGEYRGISESAEDIYGIDKAVLLTVNGTAADDFIKLSSSSLKLKYDHIGNKPFRDVLVFNDGFGEKCVIEYLDEQGGKHSLEAYCGIGVETVISYIDYFKQLDGLAESDAQMSDNTSEDEPDYTIIGDFTVSRKEEQNLLILRADAFASLSSDGDAISNMVKTYSEGIDNIVIDIRNNRGGYYEYAKRLLGALSDRDIVIGDDVYITKASYDRNKNKSAYEFDPKTKLYKTDASEAVRGEASEKKDLYLLISDSTGSSADMLAYEFKKNGLGTVIGTNNTCGERDGTLCLNFSDISGIYYTYTEYSSFNSDGKVNSVYGTAPDIYVDTDIENYFTRKELIESRKDPYILENRLEWDNVLAETLEIIKEDENVKGDSADDEQ